MQQFSNTFLGPESNQAAIKEFSGDSKAQESFVLLPFFRDLEQNILIEIGFAIFSQVEEF